MPAGRGLSEEYAKEAAKTAKKIVEEYFDDASDECRAAVMGGVFSMYAENIIPSYIFETDDHYHK